jgi:hypothetical protein
MEWTIPIQKLEVNKIQVGQLQKSIKPLTPLAYTDGPIVFQNLNLLLPPLTIKEYDVITGKLILSLSDSPGTLAKLNALQESLLTSVYNNQKLWFSDSNRTREQIQTSFQPCVESNNLYLYCPMQNQEKRHTIHIWKEGEWKRFATSGLIQKGDSIRVALRLQGISYQMNATNGSWTGRCRVQHKISCIYQFVKSVIPEQISKQKVVEEQKC